MPTGHIHVRFNDIHASFRANEADIRRAMELVLQRGDFVGGSAIAEFEREFARFCGSRHAVGCASGTAALRIALVAAGLTPGDEVITTPMTFIATAEAISHAGGRIVFADIDPQTLNLNPDAVEAAITPRTRAVIFVHLHGNPSGATQVHAVCRKHGLLFVEDCAQAHGARFEAVPGEPLRHAGTLGSFGCFSFFPAKNLGAFGDAGALITDDEQLAERARCLVNHGRKDKYVHLVEGFNDRLDTIQAAVLEAKLPRLEQAVQRRNAICDRYEQALADLPIERQALTIGGRHARHLFAIRTNRREALREFLRQRGIETGIHYPIPLHLQPAYEKLGYRNGEFPVAEKTAQTTLSLPLYAELPDEHVATVIAAVREFFGAAT